MRGRPRRRRATRPRSPTERALGAALALTALFALVPDPVRAYPVHRRLFQSAYGRATACVLCHGHGGGTERNAYGDAWAEHGEDLDAFAAIDALDSDGDGATNRAEIDAGSNAGDAESTPAAPGERWERALEEVFIPLEQLELVFDSMGRVEAAEVELGEAQAAEIGQAVGTELRLEDRLPTLYFDVQDGRRRAVAVFSQFRTRAGEYALLTSVGRDGTAERVIVFRDPDEAGHVYLPYLRCLQGRRPGALPEPGAEGCPVVEGRQDVQRQLRRSVDVVLHTVAAHLSARPAAVVPDAGDAAGDAGPAAGAAPAALDLDAVEATSAASVLPASIATVLALLLIGLFLLAVHLSAAWAGRGGGAELPRLSGLPRPARLVIAMTTLTLMATQALAVAAAYTQTQVVHESTWAYFQYLSTAKLLGTSHAHLFGYALLYGLLATFGLLTEAPARLRCVLAAAMLWAGPFDVLSWWAIRLGAPAFHYLTMATGAVAGTASLVAAFLVLRDALATRRA